MKWSSVIAIVNTFLSNIRRKLCIGRQPSNGLLRYNPIHYWSKFWKDVKQGIQLACIRCPNAQDISWWYCPKWLNIQEHPHVTEGSLLGFFSVHWFEQNLGFGYFSVWLDLKSDVIKCFIKTLYYTSGQTFFGRHLVLNELKARVTPLKNGESYVRFYPQRTIKEMGKWERKSHIREPGTRTIRIWKWKYVM